MSRNAGGGYFKDLGNLSQNFFNQIASDIRSNAEQIVSSAFQNESCERRGVPPDSDRTSQVRMSILHENTKIFRRDYRYSHQSGVICDYFEFSDLMMS